MRDRAADLRCSGQAACRGCRATAPAARPASRLRARAGAPFPLPRSAEVSRFAVGLSCGFAVSWSSHAGQVERAEVVAAFGGRAQCPLCAGYSAQRALHACERAEVAAGRGCASLRSFAAVLLPRASGLRPSAENLGPPRPPPREPRLCHRLPPRARPPPPGGGSPSAGGFSPASRASSGACGALRVKRWPSACAGASRALRQREQARRALVPASCAWVCVS